MAQIVHVAVMLAIFPFLAASLAVNSSSGDDATEQLADRFKIRSEKAEVIIPSNSTGDGTTFGELALMEEKETLSISPEQVYNVPDVESFPGCMCDWNEGYNAGWSCEATIIYPRAMVGKPCCCCTTSCLAEHRCSNDECMYLGIDQAEGVAKEAAEKEARDKEKAVPDFGDAVITMVRQPPGYCTHHTILAACKKIGQVPLCNDYGKYVSMDRGKPGCKRWRNSNWCDNNQNCWFPFMGGQGGPNEAKAAPFKKWQWVSFASKDAMQKVGLNSLKMGGSCLYAFNGGTSQAIAALGESGQWTPDKAAYNGWKWKNMEREGTVLELNQQGWPTWCVNQKPLPYVRNGLNR